MVFTPFKELGFRVFVAVDFLFQPAAQIPSDTFRINEMRNCQKTVVRKIFRMFFRQGDTFVEIFSEQQIRLRLGNSPVKPLMRLYNVSVTYCQISGNTMIRLSAGKTLVLFDKSNRLFVQSGIFFSLQESFCFFHGFIISRRRLHYNRYGRTHAA